MSTGICNLLWIRQYASSILVVLVGPYSLIIFNPSSVLAYVQCSFTLGATFGSVTQQS